MATLQAAAQDPGRSCGAYSVAVAYQLATGRELDFDMARELVHESNDGSALLSDVVAGLEKVGVPCYPADVRQSPPDSPCIVPLRRRSGGEDVFHFVVIEPIESSKHAADPTYVVYCPPHLTKLQRWTSLRPEIGPALVTFGRNCPRLSDFGALLFGALALGAALLERIMVWRRQSQS